MRHALIFDPDQPKIYNTLSNSAQIFGTDRFPLLRSIILILNWGCTKRQPTNIVK